MRFFVLLALFFLSCSDGNKILPNSTGENSEIIFVVDDKLWKNSIDSLVRNIFGASIEGVNQIEALFKIIQVNHREFKSILKTHKNVIIISDIGSKSRQRNKWSNGQLVAQLKWENSSENLLQDLIVLRKLFVKKELNLIRSYIEKSSQRNIEKILVSNFGVACVIPNEYDIIKNDSAFFWANYDPINSDEIKNILIFSFIPRTKNLQSEVLFHTDSIFARYLKGAKETSYVRIEQEYSPYFHENIYRGLWKLEHGFMGGPFLIKTHFARNKIVVNVGLVFAPQSAKRKYIKEFEAIL